MPKYYLKARMYDPVTARFMQEDTYRGKDEDPLSLNLYTYCHNNPIEYYDPTGHIAWHVIGGVIGAVAGAGINLVADYMDDGKINRGVKSYLKSAGVGALIGSTLGYGYGAYIMNAGMNAVSMIAGMTAFGMADRLIGDIIYNGGDINISKAIDQGIKYGTAEAGSQIFQYGMEKIVIPKAKMVFKEVTASFKKQAVQDAKAVMKNISKLVSAVKPSSGGMFGGLKNTPQSLNTKLPIENQGVIKSPKSLGYSTGDRISLTPKKSSLFEKGINLQLFGHKKGNAIEGTAKTSRTEIQRTKWKEYTGTDPVGEVHHGLPEQYHDWFKEHGIEDINSGEYYFDLDKGTHRLKANNGIHTNNSPLGDNWNSIWKKWTKQNPEAGLQDIRNQLDSMAKKAGIEQYRANSK